MDSVNVSSLQQNASNSSVELADEHAANVVHINSLAVFILCVLCIPGNVLVVAVYARQMTTSTRVYMFALAVADLTILVCGIVLTKFALNLLAVVIVVWLGHTTITFSVILLAFVSFERMLAVLRPHKFSTRARRAKIALVVITVAAVLASTVLAVLNLLRYKRMFELFVSLVIGLNVSVMVTCYALMAVAMVKNAKRVRVNVGVATASTTHFPLPDVSIVSNGDVTSSNYTAAASTSNRRRNGTVAPALRVKKTDKQAKLYKGYLLLFIITVVFLATWLPTWLGNAGLHVAMDLQRMYVLNSIINPFIYSVVSVMFRDDVQQFYNKTRSNLIHVFT